MCLLPGHLAGKRGKFAEGLAHSPSRHDAVRIPGFDALRCLFHASAIHPLAPLFQARCLRYMGRVWHTNERTECHAYVLCDFG